MYGGPTGQAPIVRWATRTGGGTAHNPRSGTNLRVSTYLAALAVGRPDSSTVHEFYALRGAFRRADWTGALRYRTVILF